MIHVGDNTWNIRVMITDLQVEKTLRVKGDLHIGGVMLKLSKTEGEFLGFPGALVIFAIKQMFHELNSTSRRRRKVSRNFENS